MKAIVKLFFGLIICGYFTSCEDVVQVKLDQGSKLLVVDAFINDMRSTQKVRLTYTDSYFSGQNPPGAVGAKVVLNDLTNNKVFTFTDIGNGDYNYNINTPDTIGYVGHNYQLQITYNGYVYTSLQTEHRTTSVDSIGIKYSSGDAFNKQGYYCEMWAFDKPGPVSDYYWIKAFRNGVFFNKGSEINVAIDGASGSGADGFLFIPPIARGITPTGEVYQSNGVCRAEIHSLSKETYYFLTQVKSQTTNSGLFATTPENIQTNITTPAGCPLQAIGWFNVAAVGFLERVVP
jgi:hypothetical protein